MPSLRGPGPMEMVGSGIDELKNASPVHLENGRQTSSAGGDITPTQSRATSPFLIDLAVLKNLLPRERSLQPTSRTTTNGLDASHANVDRSEFTSGAESSLAESSPETGNTSLGTPKIHDSLLSSNFTSAFPSRSLTPQTRPSAPPDVLREEEMPSSSPRAGPSPDPSRPIPTRGQQPQQQQQRSRRPHPHGYYASPASDVNLPRNPPSISRQSASASSVHAQQPTQQQHVGYAAQYATSHPTAFYPQHNQHQFTYPPPLNLSSMPPHAHTHSHPTPDFFPLGHSMSPIQPPLYAPSFQASVPPEHSPTPLSFDYDGRNVGRSPAQGPGSYTPQQPFTPFNFHPTLTTTPQFAQSHSPFSPFQAHQGQQTQRPQYPPPFAYMSRASPRTPEDATQSQPSPAWWYIPHSASPATGPYPNMYYLDAYGNPANIGTGLGHGGSSLSSPSSTAPVQHAAYSLPETIVGSRSGSVSVTGSEGIPGGPEGPIEDPNRPKSSSSSTRVALSPSAVGEPVTERQEGQQQRRLKQSSRRTIPTNLPARSEWVMWVGNVPSDATHEELWRFFTRPIVPILTSPLQFPYGQRPHQPLHLPAGLLSPSGSSSASDGNSTDTYGVVSVFPIARSNCAFVNYTSGAHLAAAVERFNGVPLRPGDARCPLLVCRVRGKDEDLKAGVGGQRGTGIHTRWVREQRERSNMHQQRGKGPQSKERTTVDTDTTSSEPPGTPSSSVVQTESGAESGHEVHPVRRPPHHSSSSGSTTSGFLSRYFPKRYFILKSLTQYDLDLSVEKGVWATQPHNESVLNQAFRNSQDVFLIFGVNKSGEFYGYARMESPIGKSSEDRVSWASRTDSQRSHSPATSFASSVAGSSSQANDTISEENEGGSPEFKDGDENKTNEQKREKKGRPVMLFSPSEHRLAEDSPQPVTPAMQKRLSNAKEVGSGKVSLADEAPSDRHLHGLTGSSRQVSRTFQGSSSPTSAPAVMGPHYRRISVQHVGDMSSETLDPRMLRCRLPSVRLDPEAPLRAVREHETRESSSVEPVEDDDGVKRRDTLNTSTSLSVPGSKLRKVLEVESTTDLQQQSSEAEVPSDRQAEDIEGQWGSSFKVQWIRVKKLPFHRTRNLRNPWNHEREVKVSRDGTELEPSVGQALLDEWDKEEPPEPPSVLGTGGTGASSSVTGKHASQLRRLQSAVQTPSSNGREANPSLGPFRVQQDKQRPRNESSKTTN